MSTAGLEAPRMKRRLSVTLLLAVATATLVASAASAAQTPYNGSPFQLPTTIQAEQYDRGGEGVAWHDTTPGNVFNTYRSDDMDVGAIVGASGYHVGYLANGEWAEYTVSSPVSQYWEIRLRLASNYTLPTSFHIEVDGIDRTGSRSVGYTGGWHNYTLMTIPSVYIPAGTRVLRIVFEVGAFNLDWLEVRGQTPWGSSPADVPGTIQAENYDRGGEGIAWHDTTSGNVFNTYRSDDMDVGAIVGAGGYHVGYLTNGEWAEYTIDVNQTQSYEMRLRYASAYTGTTRFRVLVDGTDRSGTQTITSTGGWHSYTIKTVPLGTLAAGGGRVLRLAFDIGSWNLDWFEIRSASCTAPAITLHPSGGTITPHGGRSFSAAASGTPAPSFQWYRDGQAISGATGSSYTVTDGRLPDQGNYTVTATNSCGSATSNAAFLKVSCAELPGNLEESLSEALQGRPEVCDWNDNWNRYWPNSMGGGSYNKEVLAAAIALIVDPTRPGPAAGKDVDDWWITYLQGELGERGSQWYYGGREPFSFIYQHYNIAAVMAVNYQAKVTGRNTLRSYARRWLQATFALQAAAAVSKPSTLHDGTVVRNPPSNYSGPYLPMAGMRSSWGSWEWMYRNILFAKAVGLATNAGGEPSYQKSLRQFLEGQDNGWPSSEGDIYGLTSSQKSDLAAILSTGQLPGSFSSLTGGVRTIVPYHIVAWPGVRVTLMEGNVNGNTVPTYGALAQGSAVYFLYPWQRGGSKHRQCIRGGSARIELGVPSPYIWATNGPEDYPSGHACIGRHPEEEETLALPVGTPQYHLIY